MVSWKCISQSENYRRVLTLGNMESHIHEQDTSSAAGLKVVHGRLVVVRRSTCPSPPSPGLLKDRGSESPRHSTPADDAFRTEDRTLAEYIPYRSSKTTVATPLASATALLTRGLLTPLGSSSATTRWNPVTGFRELLSRRASGSSSLDGNDANDHDAIAELPGSTPASAPHQRMELETAASPPPRRSASSTTAGATRPSTRKPTVSNEEEDHEEREDYHDHHERLGPCQTDDTKDVTTKYPDAVECGLPSVLDLRRMEGLLRDGVLMLLWDNLQRLSQRRHLVQRGRDEALGELWQELRARAAARHVGVAEARILRREADAIFRMIKSGSKDGDGEWEDEEEQVEKAMADEREKALEDIIKIVETVAATACAAAEAVVAALGTGAAGAGDAPASSAVDDVARSDL